MVYRQLVQVEDKPGKQGRGQIELTWRTSRTAVRHVRSTTGTYAKDHVEDFTQTETVTYSDAGERAGLLKRFGPDAT